MSYLFCALIAFLSGLTGYFVLDYPPLWFIVLIAVLCLGSGFRMAKNTAENSTGVFMGVVGFFLCLLPGFLVGLLIKTFQ